MTKETLTTTKSVPVKMKIITGAEGISKGIASISKRGKAFERDVHCLAVSTLIHADKHGDVTLANKLIDALPASQRKNALRDWYLAFGKFKYDEKNKALGFNGAAGTQTDKAIETPFWEFKPEQEYVPFNAIKAVENLLKRIDNAKNKGDEVPEVLESALKEVQAKLTKPDVLAA